MDLHHRPQRQSSVTPQSPRSPVDHFHHQGDPDSPTMMRGHDPELDHGHHRHKLSVLAKVKEKARKWRQTLTRKNHGDINNNATPSWGVTLEDDPGEEDQEHVGGYLPPIFEKNVLLDDGGVGENREQEQTARPDKKVAFVVTEKPLPSDTAVSAATDARASKIRNISIDSPGTTPPTSSSSSSENISKVHIIPAPSSSRARATATATATSLGLGLGGDDDDGVSPQKNQEQEEEEVEEEKTAAAGGGTWVKEYLIQKLEPGENERALSQLISETVMSPGDVGVVEKIKEAVTSLLATNQPPSSVHSPVPVSINPHQGKTLLGKKKVMGEDYR